VASRTVPGPKLASSSHVRTGKPQQQAAATPAAASPVAFAPEASRKRSADRKAMEGTKKVKPNSSPSSTAEDEAAAGTAPVPMLARLLDRHGLLHEEGGAGHVAGLGSSTDGHDTPAESSSVPPAEIPLIRSLWKSKSGFKNVTYNGTERAAKRPWQARDETGKSLGMFKTAEEAAAAYSRSLGRDLADRLSRAVEREQMPMTAEEALRAAANEGLVLVKNSRPSSSPYKNVYRVGNGPRCYLARWQPGPSEGSRESLGCYATPEEAALALARYLVLR
jgi:hypothetical protein